MMFPWVNVIPHCDLDHIRPGDALFSYNVPPQCWIAVSISIPDVDSGVTVVFLTPTGIFNWTNEALTMRLYFQDIIHVR